MSLEGDMSCGKSGLRCGECAAFTTPPVGVSSAEG